MTALPILEPEPERADGGDSRLELVSPTTRRLPNEPEPSLFEQGWKPEWAAESPIETEPPPPPASDPLTGSPKARAAAEEARRRGYYTPTTFAAAMFVSKRTVDGWLARREVPGAWKTTNTDAGHWRIPLDAPEPMRRSRQTRKEM